MNEKKLWDCTFNELMNYEAVYRTAPATPGLLNTTGFNSINLVVSVTVEWHNLFLSFFMLQALSFKDMKVVIKLKLNDLLKTKFTVSAIFDIH